MRGLKTRRLWEAVRSAWACLLYLTCDVRLTFVFDSIRGYKRASSASGEGAEGARERERVLGGKGRD